MIYTNFVSSFMGTFYFDYPVYTKPGEGGGVFITENYKPYTNTLKSFSGQAAVNNISLNIERNSVYGLLGPNGAGKSTTLKMITGILKPTSGNIEFDGHAWKRSDLNHIGALIEMPLLYENLTAYENLKVRTTILGLTDKRIDEVLQIVRLTETSWTVFSWYETASWNCGCITKQPETAHT